MLTLYTYFRSSATYRVRIALHLKGLPYTSVPVHLLRGGGEQHAPAYAQLNPAELVPTLVEGDVALGQSLAIMEYLEERHPAPALLPVDAAGRARVRALAQSIACDIHPLNNLRVMRYLEREWNVPQAERDAWTRHWIMEGFDAFETLLEGHPATGTFCDGFAPTIADCCLVPQLFNARRFDIDLAPFPALLRIDAACAQLPAFQLAHPARQPDAE